MHPLTEQYIPEGLAPEIYEIADSVFSCELNTPFSTDKDTDEFYFTVPQPIMDDLDDEDRDLMLRVLQFDQLTPSLLAGYHDDKISGEKWDYIAQELLVKGTSLAERIDSELGHHYARARIWHHAAGTAYRMSPEHQEIAVRSIEFLLQEIQDPDADTQGILDVWDRFIHNRYDILLSEREENGRADPFYTLKP